VIYSCNPSGNRALDDSVKGFNIGVNCGIVAGQSIFHCHILLIPRRIGDVPNSKGGVRHVIRLPLSIYNFMYDPKDAQTVNQGEKIEKDTGLVAPE